MNRNNVIIKGNIIILNIYKEDDVVIDYPEDQEIKMNILDAFLTTSPLKSPFQILKKGGPTTLYKLFGKLNDQQLFVTLHGYDDMKIDLGSKQDELNAIFEKHILGQLVHVRLDRIKQGMRNVLEFENPGEFIANLNKFLMNVAI